MLKGMRFGLDIVILTGGRKYFNNLYPAILDLVRKSQAIGGDIKLIEISEDELLNLPEGSCEAERRQELHRQAVHRPKTHDAKKALNEERALNYVTRSAQELFGKPRMDLDKTDPAGLWRP
jgi:hypothetical protein